MVQSLKIEVPHDGKTGATPVLSRSCKGSAPERATGRPGRPEPRDEPSQNIRHGDCVLLAKDEGDGCAVRAFLRRGLSRSLPQGNGRYFFGNPETPSHILIAKDERHGVICAGCRPGSAGGRRGDVSICDKFYTTNFIGGIGL